MSPIEGLRYGFSVILVPTNILAVVTGSFIGTLIGVLPGIGPVGTMAIMLPIVMALKMSPLTALTMFAGVYYGAMYGGSTTSILMSVPGEATTVVTCIDGYQMAKKGRAGAALAVAAVGSWVAGTLGVIGLMFFAPTLAQFALSFGPPEYFGIALLALVVLSRISGRPFGESVFVLALGMALATIGIDPISGDNRFTFGWVQLSQGIDVIPVVMGLFGIAEVLNIAEQAGGLPRAKGVKIRELFPTRSEWRRAAPAMFRGSILGFFWGLIPGPSTVLSTFGSYKLERRLSRHPEEFGHGAIEGVAGPEAANNAAGGGALVPLLSLGLPFTPGIAMLFAGLMVLGVQPGPLLINEHPEIFWGVVAALYIGNVVLLVLNFPLVGVWVSILRVRQSLLLTLIVLLCLVGVYSLNNSSFDLVIMLMFGAIGYILRKLDFDVSPMVIAMIIGPMLEEALRQSLVMAQGNPFVFFQRPISCVLVSISFIVLIAMLAWHFLKRRLVAFRK